MSFLWDCKLPQTSNLAFMHSFFSTAIVWACIYGLVCVWVCGCVCLQIYKLHMILPTPLSFTVQCYFPQSGREWTDARKKKKESKGEGVEDKHVLRAHICLFLYQLSSSSPLERLNHKRALSQEDTLFSPTLNIMYYIAWTHTTSSSFEYSSYSSSQP